MIGNFLFNFYYVSSVFVGSFDKIHSDEITISMSKYCLFLQVNVMIKQISSIWITSQVSYITYISFSK